MAVKELLEQLRGPKVQQPNYILGNNPGGVSRPKLGAATGGFKFKSPVAGGDENVGALLSSSLLGRRNTGSVFQHNYKTQEVNELATDVLGKSSGRINTNEWGIPTRNKPNLTESFKQHSGSINQWGKTALQAEEARNAWHQAVQIQNLNQYSMVPGSMSVYDAGDLPAGTNDSSVGGRAVALAMTAYKNKTPYVWGGNSLTNGVDCSGLIQQIYKRLGINLPRTTYEQAKYGKQIGMGSLKPGDLVFYNTGGRDPNGIGTLSHVAIYIGNGKVIEAANKRTGVRVSNLNYSGTPARAVRPW